MQIKKAVFPVAGSGSRFLPATKANPKEMLPIVDKPLIQHAVEEAIRAGIDHMIFVTSAGKRSIEDHFDKQFELETRLQQQNKHNLLDLITQVAPAGIHFTYVRQNQPLGLGHAVLCAQHVVGDEPFAVLLADDLIDDSRLPCLAAMAECFSSEGHSILAVQPVPWADVPLYGIVQVEQAWQDYSAMTAMVEKPALSEARSNLAAIGRYIFTPTIFSCLQQTQPDAQGEIQLTGAIQLLLAQEKVMAWQFHGQRFDCGSKLGYMQAAVEFALRHVEIGNAFKEYIRNLNLN